MNSNKPPVDSPRVGQRINCSALDRIDKLRRAATSKQSKTQAESRREAVLGQQQLLASTMAVAAAAEDEDVAAPHKLPSPSAGAKKKPAGELGRRKSGLGRQGGRRLVQRLRRWYIVRLTNFWRNVVDKPQSNTFVPVWLRRHLTYYRIHLTYFTVAILITSIFLWGNWGEGTEHLDYVDALFIATSAMCVTGMTTIDMARLSVMSQVIICVLMISGSQVFMSLVPVLVRRYYFKRAVLEMTFHEPPAYAVPPLAQPVLARTDTKSNGGSIREGPQLRRPAPLILTPAVETEDDVVVKVQPKASKKAFRFIQRTLQEMDPQHRPPHLSQLSRFVRSRSLTGAADKPSTSLSAQNSFSSGSTRPRIHSVNSIDLAASLADFEVLHEENAARPSQEYPTIARPQLARSVTTCVVAPQPAKKKVHLMRAVTTLDSSWRVPDTPADTSEFDPNITWSGGEDPLQILQHHRNSLSQITGDPIPITGTELLETMEKLQRIRTRAAKYLADEAYLAEASKRLRQSIEYNALRELSMLVPLYFLAIQLVGILLIRIEFIYDATTSNLLKQNFVNPWWFSVFQGVSAFNNAGFSLLSANMIPFQRATLILLVMSALILLGNTAFPIVLREIIRLRSRYAHSAEQRDACTYLLKYPRRCFTHLFPAAQTRILFVALAVINAVEFFFFQVLDWDSPAVEGLQPGHKLVTGLFQSIATRSAGLNAVNVALLSPAMVWLYTGLMYLAVYPLYISRQNSQVTDEYELKELGLTHEEALLERAEADHVWVQGRKLLLRDTVLLFMSIFVICIIEKPQFDRHDPYFQVFAVLFEIISAYGNVGLTLGYPTVVYTFAGTWHALSKLVLILIILLGRHRGLPEDIDRALQLPKSDSGPNTSLRTHPLTAQVSPASVANPPPSTANNTANNTATMPAQHQQTPATPTHFPSPLQHAVSAVARVGRSSSFPIKHTNAARGMPSPTPSRTGLSPPSSNVSDLLKEQGDKWLPTVRESSQASETNTPSHASHSSTSQQLQQLLDLSARDST
eukprot:jgi/Chlat1/3665/Chrsp24S03855